MNLDEKGWLGAYIDERKANYVRKTETDSRHPDFSLYNLLQPTGLLYGNPVQSENLRKGIFLNLSKKLRLRILLAESLINTCLFFRKNKINDNEDFRKELDLSISRIADFYNNVYPEIAVNRKSFLGKSRSDQEVAEKVLEKRIEQKPSHQNNFWIGFFTNTLLFLDVYFFSQWIHTSNDEILAKYFREESEELRLSVIKVIVAAAHANNIVEVEERKLFEYILNAADLSGKRKKEAWGLLDHGVLVEEIGLPDNNSWLLKKYFLELAILTVSADRVVDNKEKEFLLNFSKHLGFFEEDLEDSMIALEGFIIENWDEMGELQNRKNLSQLSEEYELRLSKLLNKHKKKLIHELSEDESVIRLIRKYKEGNIDPENQERLQFMLIKILQNLPSFSSITLPKSLLHLENLMRIIPELPKENT